MRFRYEIRKNVNLPHTTTQFVKRKQNDIQDDVTRDAKRS